MPIFGKSLQFLLSIVSTGLPESVLTHFFPIIKLLEFCFHFYGKNTFTVRSQVHGYACM